MRIKIGSFNVFNLVRSGEPYYNKPPYTDGEFSRKADWIAGQLKRMEAQIAGFQEVFHEDALLDVTQRSALYDGGTVISPGADGSGPRVGLATSLEVVGQPETIKNFPDGFSVSYSFGGATVEVTQFQRAILKVTVRLDAQNTLRVFVTHLKSKRPIILPAEDEHDFKARARGKARSLVVRAAEAAALRAILVDELQGNQQAAVVIGDLNDDQHAVSTEMVSGTPPWRFLPATRKREIWDVLLYNTYEIQARQSPRDVSFSYIYNGNYNTIDHIFVSQELYRFNPNRIGEVEYLRFFNDHIVDSTLTSGNSDRIESDHGQLVATIRM